MYIERERERLYTNLDSVPQAPSSPAPAPRRCRSWRAAPGGADFNDNFRIVM